MTFHTVNVLQYWKDDVKGDISEGEEIKIYLKSGEILIGNYESSDFECLDLERNSDYIEIMFRDIEDLEVIKNENL